MVFWAEAGTLYTVLMRGVLMKSGYTVYSINAWCSGEKRYTVYIINAWCSGEKRVHYIEY